MGTGGDVGRKQYAVTVPSVGQSLPFCKGPWILHASPTGSKMHGNPELRTSLSGSGTLGHSPSSLMAILALAMITFSVVL